MPLFFFPCRDQREMANRERGKKRAKRGEKSRENGNRTRNAQRNTAHGAKISSYKPDKRHARTRTPPTARTTRKRPKKGNGQNTHGSPPREHGRSDHGRSATERGRRNLSASSRAYAPTRGETVGAQKKTSPESKVCSVYFVSAVFASGILGELPLNPSEEIPAKVFAK